ncbi:MAG TPA: peptidoglycan DD-metalloendopeptidase family protein, partial [Candidatus Limnocylindria bacterium]
MTSRSGHDQDQRSRDYSPASTDVGTRFGVALEPVLANQWFDLGTRAAEAARGPRPTEANRFLSSAVEAEPQSPLASVYLLWMGNNLVREGRHADAIDAYHRTLVAVDASAPLEVPWDVRGAALKDLASAHERAGNVGAAIQALRELGTVRKDDLEPLYRAGVVAERAGLTDEARDLYRNASGRTRAARASSWADLARRAAARLEEPATAFRPTLSDLVREMRSAIRDRDGSRLAALRSNTHFSVGPVGGEAAFEDLEVADSLLAELSSRRISVHRPLRGSGGKRYLRTTGWKSARFRGEVLLVVIRTARGWQWSGIALAYPTEEWIARWQPVELATNQPLPFALKAPWPAGQSFMAGGIRDFSWKMGLVAAAGFFGGPILAYGFSRNDCGFGPRGYYYNAVFSHKGNSAFAIDFTRYKYGRPFNNISEGTPVLAPADGWVWDVESNVTSGNDPGYGNEVDIIHPDPATGMDRFVSRHLHLAGPGKVLVNKFAPVAVGNRLGVMDDTGESWLHHLHFSIHDQQLPHPGLKYGPSIRPSPMDGRALGDGDSGTCVRSTNVETQPPTWLDDVANPELFESQHFVHTETADRLHLWTLTGVVLLHQRGTGRDWLRAQVKIKITVPEIPAGGALRLVHWAPFVTINAIQNDDTSNWAGWAVDRFRLVNPGDHITDQVTVETD